MAAEVPCADKLTLAEVYLVPSPDGGLTMRAPRRSAVLRGKLVTDVFPRLLPLLDGTRTAEEIVDQIPGDEDPDQLTVALERLKELGVIESAYETHPSVSDEVQDRLRSQYRFFRQYGGDNKTVDRIANSTVLLAGAGPLLPAIALNLLASGVGSLLVAGTDVVQSTDVAQSVHVGREDIGCAWVEVVRSLVDRSGLRARVAAADSPDTKLGWQQLLARVDCAVLALDSPVISLPWVDELNKAALAESTPWTSASLLQRAVIHLGPTVLPGDTACWKCFQYRFKSNLSAASKYDEFEEFTATATTTRDGGSVPSVAEFTGSLVAFETMRILGSGELYVRTAGVLLTLDLWDLRMETHPVLKLPRCPHCSSVSAVPQERLWS